MQIYAVGLLAHKISSQLSSAPQAEQVRKIYDRQLRDDRDRWRAVHVPCCGAGFRRSAPQ